MPAIAAIEPWVLLIVLLVYGGAISAIVLTKTQGWGRFSTSILLLTLVLFSATVAVILKGIQYPEFANLLFAVGGFAGALLTGKEEKEGGRASEPTARDDR